MHASTLTCTRITDIGFGRIQAVFSAEIAPRAGQFLLLQTAPSDTTALLHRETVYPFAITPAGFTLEFQPGNIPATLVPNATFDALGPFGHPYQFAARQPRILLIADQNPAPLFALADAAIAQRGEVMLLLGQPYPVRTLRPEIEVQIGHLPKLFSQTQTWADAVFTTTEQTFPQAKRLFSGSLPCGIGACHACYVRTPQGAVLACKKGPWLAVAPD